MKRHFHVACAIIELDGKVLAAQRSASMTLPLKWEFPGGKIEAGESPEQCVVREICEELGVSVAVKAPFSPATHSYPDFTVTLYPFTCRLAGGVITAHEHHALQWVAPHRMPELDWAWGYPYALALIVVTALLYFINAILHFSGRDKLSFLYIDSFARIGSCRD